jgi:hypothetical protein
VTQSADVALQVEGQNGLLVLSGGRVNANGTGAVVSGGGRLKVTNTAFTGNGLHIEALAQSKVFIEGATFSGSTDGVGIIGQSGAVLHIEKSKVSDESKYGIVSATDATIAGGAVSGCGLAGIVFLSGAKGKLTDCAIEGNKGDGVRIIGGTPDLKGCTIQKNGGYGVVRAKECIDADVKGNTVEGNTAGNSVTGEFQAA